MGAHSRASGLDRSVQTRSLRAGRSRLRSTRQAPALSLNRAVQQNTARIRQQCPRAWQRRGHIAKQRADASAAPALARSAVAPVAARRAAFELFLGLALGAGDLFAGR